MTPPASHRCDEFPAEYSLASCSPAELASASSATLMLQPTTFVRRSKISERQPGNFRTVSAQGVTPVPALGQNSPILARNLRVSRLNQINSLLNSLLQGIGKELLSFYGGFYIAVSA